MTARRMAFFALVLGTTGAACLGKGAPGPPGSPASAAASVDAGDAGPPESCGDRRTSAEHCGACGHRCGESQTCVESRCVEHAGLAVGGSHACAIFAEGRVACWGANDRGQLGLGTVSSSEPPGWVPGVTDVVELAAGALSTCALEGDGTVRCWGGNTHGQLGDGMLADRPEGKPIAGLGDAIHLAASGEDVCVLRRTGAMSCWGYDPGAPFGSAHLDRRRPAEIALPFEPVGIAVGPASECAWAADGRIACRGERPILVHATQGVVIVPDAVVVQSVAGTVAMGFGESRSCAIRRDGALSCWGLRLFTPPSHVLDETAVEVPGVSDVAEIAGGWEFMLARRRDGSLLTWGRRDGLGWGPDSADGAPRGVPGLTGIAQMALGGFFCARLLGGKIVCSGRDQAGHLGDGTLDEGPVSPREVLAPGAMDHARWLTVLADGEGDACRLAADCGWDDACAPKRCQGKASHPEAPVCGGPPVSPGECTCTSGHCMLRPKQPPSPPEGSCARVGCGVDQMAGHCVLGSGSRGNGGRNPDGPSCACDRTTDRCAFTWRVATPCHEDADCRPPGLRKQRFRPCIDGEAAPMCIQGKCGFGPPIPC